MAQNVYLCQSCGLLFIDPVLSDADTIELIFQAEDRPLAPLLDGGWCRPAFERAPSIWSTAVRVPSLNETLRPFLDKAIRVIDVGSRGGDVSLNLDLPTGSQVDLVQVQNEFAAASPDSPMLSDLRQFNGLLIDLVEADAEYRADLVLAIHVLEHVDDARQFLRHCRRLLAPDGLLLVEVPYEPFVARNVASDRIFELAHNLFFTPWSLRYLLQATGFTIEKFEHLNLAHTGVGVDPYSVLRVVCSTHPAPDPDLVKLGVRNYCRSIDAVLGSFAGSIVFESDARFGVFAFEERARGMAELFCERPGYRGVFTSNPDLNAPNVFQGVPEEIQYLITLNEQDREALRQNLRSHVTII